MIKVALIGYGGFGRELEACLNCDDRYEYLGFYDDGARDYSGKNFLGTLDDLMRNKEEIHLIISITAPAVRRAISERLVSKNFRFPNYIHPKALLLNSTITEQNRGNIIMPHAVLTTDIRMGNFNIVHIGCYISHDTVLGDYNTLQAGAMIRSGGEFGSENLIKG